MIHNIHKTYNPDAPFSERLDYAAELISQLFEELDDKNLLIETDKYVIQVIPSDLYHRINTLHK